MKKGNCLSDEEMFRELKKEQKFFPDYFFGEDIFGRPKEDNSSPFGDNLSEDERIKELRDERKNFPTFCHTRRPGVLVKRVNRKNK
jgi:hypothetical protein